jgi:hypothetical protein
MRDAILCSLLLAKAPVALACSCMGPRPVCSEYFKTPLIFYGRVVAKVHVPSPSVRPGEMPSGRFEVHFSVIEPMRGDAGPEVVVATSDVGPMCGVNFSEGASYVVYATENPKWHLWSTGTCMRTHVVGDPARDEDLQWFHALQSAPAGGTIYGKVRNFMGRNPDSTGKVGFLPGTKITANGPDSRVATANDAGDFRLDGLTPGRYTVDASPPPGFAAMKSASVSIELKGCAQVDFETRLDGHIRGHAYFADGRPAADIFMTANNVNVRFGEGFYSTTSGDGSFDFGPLTPGTYSFGVTVQSPWAKGYNQSAVFPEKINVGPSEATADLRFVLAPDRPAPSIPVEVFVLDRQGRPLANATVLTDDAAWPNLHADPKRTDSAGRLTLLLRKGSYYDIWAYAEAPANKQQCAEPVGIAADQDAPGPIQLTISHDVGNCAQFKKPRPAQ